MRFHRGTHRRPRNLGKPHRFESEPRTVIHENLNADFKRFTGPQILRFRRKYPERYEATVRISLASSFLASLLLGRIAPIDISDVCGMNLWNIQKREWSSELLEIVGGNAKDLRSKLGDVGMKGGVHLGTINAYFSSRYKFPKGYPNP